MTRSTVETLRIHSPPLPRRTRNNHATFVVGTRLYVHGGHDGVKWLADLHVLDTERLEWSSPQPAGVLPSARACHSATPLPAVRKVVMFGGYDGARCFNDLDVLDLDTLTWIQPRVSGTLPQPRNAQTVVAVGSKLFLFGGHSGNKHLRDLLVLNTDTMAWSTPEPRGVPPPGLRGHTANLIGTKMVVFGGYDGRGRSNDLYLLDTVSMKWEHPSSNESTPVGRQRHTAALVSSKRLFVLGGFDGYKWLSDLHVLDFGKLEEDAMAVSSIASLLADFGSLVNNPDSFPDVTFLVEGGPVVAHKGILVSRSSHFRAMFSSNMVEARSTVVDLSGGPGEDSLYTRPAFIAMLEFLYTGSVRDLTPPTALECLMLAEYLRIDDLKALAETGLVHAIDATSVCGLLSAAHKAGAPSLKKSCVEFILKNFEEVDLGGLEGSPQLLVEITRMSLGGGRYGK